MPPGGYQWHYIDALSDDGAVALIVILFVGNPFSPWYAAKRGSAADPLQHGAVNVALHAPGSRNWVFTERGVATGARTADAMVLGASTAHWEGSRLVLSVDEVTSPFPRLGRRRLRGRVVLHPQCLPAVCVDLDGRGRHTWWPVAPRARVEATFSEPDLTFRGTGYHDANAGQEPLGEGFERWTWSRGHSRTGNARVAYDVETREGRMRSIAVDVDSHGEVRALEGLEAAALHRTRWGLARRVQSDAGERPVLVRTFEDGPFYARSQVCARQRGEELLLLHETMSVQRLRARWVRRLLPFRMTRVQG